MRRRVASEGVDWLLETILQPSKDMAPQYTPWQIVTTDGKTLNPLEAHGVKAMSIGENAKPT